MCQTWLHSPLTVKSIKPVVNRSCTAMTDRSISIKINYSKSTLQTPTTCSFFWSIPTVFCPVKHQNDKWKIWGVWLQFHTCVLALLGSATLSNFSGRIVNLKTADVSWRLSSLALLSAHHHQQTTHNLEQVTCNFTRMRGMDYVSRFVKF